MPGSLSAFFTFADYSSLRKCADMSDHVESHSEIATEAVVKSGRRDHVTFSFDPQLSGITELDSSFSNNVATCTMELATNASILVPNIEP